MILENFYDVVAAAVEGAITKEEVYTRIIAAIDKEYGLKVTVEVYPVTEEDKRLRRAPTMRIVLVQPNWVH